MKNNRSIHGFSSPGLKAMFASTTKHHPGTGILIIIIMLTAFGCGGPSIDASSQDSMQKSIEHIRSTLDTSERIAFDAALTDLNDILFNTTDAVSRATISKYRPETLLRKILHGKSAREVITMVAEYKREHQL
jgi:hypothetical protein